MTYLNQHDNTFTYKNTQNKQLKITKQNKQLKINDKFKKQKIKMV